MATPGVDTTLRISFGIVHGLLLAMAFPLCYVMMPIFTRANPIVVLICIIPLISYIWGLGLNALSQYITCKAVSGQQIALASTIGPVFVLLFSTIAYFASFLRAPVESVLPLSADADMKYALGFSFYLLWAGMYAQTIASGMVQSCPK
jgi:hypothetical protein